MLHAECASAAIDNEATVSATSTSMSENPRFIRPSPAPPR